MFSKPSYTYNLAWFFSLKALQRLGGECGCGPLVYLPQPRFHRNFMLQKNQISQSAKLWNKSKPIPNLENLSSCCPWRQELRKMSRALTCLWWLPRSILVLSACLLRFKKGYWRFKLKWWLSFKSPLLQISLRCSFGFNPINVCPAMTSYSIRKDKETDPEIFREDTGQELTWSKKNQSSNGIFDPTRNGNSLLISGI